jgi:tight adherence protein C
VTALMGAAVGLLAGIGIVTAVLGSPPMRRVSIAQRIAPYLRDSPAASRLLSGDRPAPASIARRLAAPLLRDAVKLLDKLVGGSVSVTRRLRALGSAGTVEQFRVEQVLWGACGGACGLMLALIAVVSHHRNPILLVAVVLGAAVGGVLARDWWLSQAVARRNSELLAEFPVIAEMLALAVAAGAGPLAAIDRITRLAHGHLSRKLQAIVADTRAGAPIQQALITAREENQLEPLARFFDGMAVAIERGTPLAEVLRAQAADVRALSKRRLLEAGGKKEILMMVPVVFLVLPITILFAFFPGLIAITTVAQ